MRMVMDVMFLEVLEFTLPIATYAPCRVASSMEEILRQAMTAVGIELIDYGSFTATTVMPAPVNGVVDGAKATVEISAYSKAYRERMERAAAILNG
jgi:hypothetical protein